MAGQLTKLEKAYRQHPDLPLFARLAEQCLLQGVVYKAIELCQRGCERFPDDPTGYLVLARCHQQLREWESARKAIVLALRLDPDNPAGFKQLATCYEELGNPALARKSLTQAVRLDPLDQQTLKRLDQFDYDERLAAVVSASEPYDELPTETDIQSAERRQQDRHTKADDQGEHEPLPLPDVPLDPQSSSDEPGADERQETPVEADEPADLEPPAASLTLADQPEEQETAAPEPAHTVVEEAPLEDRQVMEPAVREPDSSSPGVRSDETPAGEPATTEDGSTEEEPSREASSADVSPDASAAHSGKDDQDESLPMPDDGELIKVFREIETAMRDGSRVPAAAAELPAEGTGADDSDKHQEPAAVASVEKRAAPTAPSPVAPVEHLVTATLAEIYCLQGLKAQAIEVYRLLLLKDPGNRMFIARLAELEGSGSEGGPPKPEEKR